MDRFDTQLQTEAKIINNSTNASCSYHIYAANVKSQQDLSNVAIMRSVSMLFASVGWFLWPSSGGKVLLWYCLS
jgi:hypothetical protein